MAGTAVCFYMYCIIPYEAMLCIALYHMRPYRSMAGSAVCFYMYAAISVGLALYSLYARSAFAWYSMISALGIGIGMTSFRCENRL